MSVIGVDPGIHGALATVGDHGLECVVDMPTFSQRVGRSVRQRVNAVELIEHLEMQKLLGAELVVIEAVGGRPKQSASGAFVLGYTVGLIYMACVSLRLPIETVPPQVWKKVMRMPGKKDADDGNKATKALEDSIMARGLEVFPDHAAEFQGPRGGRRIDRIEAAMMAVYGHRHVLGSVQPDAEWRMTYQRAETGA